MGMDNHHNNIDIDLPLDSIDSVIIGAEKLSKNGSSGEFRGFLEEVIPLLKFVQQKVKAGISFSSRPRSSGKSSQEEDALLSYIPVIRKLELFKNLDLDNLASIMKTMTLHFYPENDFVIKKGSIGESLLILVGGEVEVLIPDPSGEVRRVATFKENDVFGEIALLTGEPRTADIRAIEPSTILELHKKDFEALCQKNPQASTVLTKLLADRLGSDSGSMLSKAIGKYQILKQIGQGGMGIVYKAEDSELGREVAMKMLPHKMVFQENFVKQFLSEGKMVARLDHENIVRLYDVVSAYGTYFLVLEFIEGDSLEDSLRKKKTLPIGEVLAIIDQISASLDHAKTLGIVHRDIKPDNIKFTADGKVKLMDFGIAAVTGGDIDDDNQGCAAGTLNYMSPEQGQGRDTDYRSDIYSFGVVCYKMLTGRTPFRGKSIFAVVMQQLTKPAVTPSKYNEEIPPWLDEFILSSLNKDVDARLASFEGIRKIINHINAGTYPMNSSFLMEDGNFVLGKDGQPVLLQSVAESRLDLLKSHLSKLTYFHLFLGILVALFSSLFTLIISKAL